MQLLLFVVATQLLGGTQTASELSFNIPGQTFKIQSYYYNIFLYVECRDSASLFVKVFQDGANLLGQDYIYSRQTGYYGQYIYLNVEKNGIYYVRLQPKSLQSDFLRCYITQYGQSYQTVLEQYFYLINQTDYNFKPTIFQYTWGKNISIKYNSTSSYITNILAYDTSTKKITTMSYNKYVQLPQGSKIFIVNHTVTYTLSLKPQTLLLSQQYHSLSTLDSGAVIGIVAGVGVVGIFVIIFLFHYCRKPNQQPKKDDAPLQSAQNIHASNPNISEDIVCTICLENTCNKTLLCSHSFHSYCIAEWMKRNKQCPLCRAENKSNI